jgi:hypothetical protein
MTQISYLWNGSTVGDAIQALYGEDDYALLWKMLNEVDRTKEGVIWTQHPTYDDKLEVTNPAGSTIRTANGAALVDGMLYVNTANVDNVLGAPPGA